MSLLKSKELMARFSMIFQAQGLKSCISCHKLPEGDFYTTVKLVQVTCVRIRLRESQCSQRSAGIAYKTGKWHQFGCENFRTTLTSFVRGELAPSIYH